LVPCQASFDDVESAVPYLRALRRGGAAPVVVVNRSRPRLNVAIERGMLIEAAELCPMELGERADYARAGARGLGLADVAGHVGGDEVRALWAYVKQRLRLAPAKPARVRRPRHAAV
jgi:chromosome partitioning protein